MISQLTHTIRVRFEMRVDRLFTHTHSLLSLSHVPHR